MDVIYVVINATAAAVRPACRRRRRNFCRSSMVKIVLNIVQNSDYDMGSSPERF
jgi:hypothetical protein